MHSSFVYILPSVTAFLGIGVVQCVTSKPVSDVMFFFIQSIIHSDSLWRPDKV